jgi:hypothetical protein
MDLPKVDGRRTIAIDFNGVLDTYQGWNGSATSYPPRKGVEQFLNTLLVRGFKIIVYTASNIQEVAQWLIKYGLDVFIDDVVNTKPPAIVYLDDRAITFKGNFAEALDAIEHFKTFWEPDNIKTGDLW